LTDEEHEVWEERAAIMEHDAGIPRDKAEQLALELIAEMRGS